MENREKINELKVQKNKLICAREEYENELEINEKAYDIVTKKASKSIKVYVFSMGAVIAISIFASKYGEGFVLTSIPTAVGVISISSYIFDKSKATLYEFNANMKREVINAINTNIENIDEEIEELDPEYGTLVRRLTK